MVGASGSEEWLIVAEFGPAHGLRGEITARLAGVAPEQLAEVPGLKLRRPDGSEKPAVVLGVRHKKAGSILKLAGIDDRTAAEDHRGSVIVARRDALPPPGDDEWWIVDLVGAVVETGDGERLGVLEEVLSLPANDVFVVRGKRGEILLPVIDDVVKRVDVEAGRVIVALLPGLLEASSGAGPGEGSEA